MQSRGTRFDLWTTWKTGTAQQFIPRVRKALASMTSKIAYPFSGTYPLTQGFGPTTFTGEPPGFWFSDKSLDYYNAADPAFPSLTSQRLDHAHAGLDFGCPTATPILAVADGVVSFAGQDQTGFGNCIKVMHSALGVTSLYGHLESFTVKQGQAVKAGQQIALSNNTGNSTGPHLHLSLIRNSDGHYIDPSPYLSTTPVKPPLPPKPTDPVKWVNFSATTMVGTTKLYLGPHTKCQVLGEVGPGVTLQLSAFTLGEPRMDFSIRAFDRRWYYLSSPDVKGSGWISSSRVNGNAPGSSA